MDNTKLMIATGKGCTEDEMPTIQFPGQTDETITIMEISISIPGKDTALVVMVHQEGYSDQEYIIRCSKKYNLMGSYTYAGAPSHLHPYLKWVFDTGINLAHQNYPHIPVF